MPVPNSPSFFPTRSFPFTSPTPPTTPSTGGSVTKGFAGIPTAQLAVQAIAHARALAGAAPVPASSGHNVSLADGQGGEPRSAASKSSAPLFHALFLFGPGNDVFRALVDDMVPTLDVESGAMGTWISITDPRRTRAATLERYGAMGVDVDSYQQAWDQRLRERADVRDHLAEETHLLAQELNIPIDRLPVLVVYPTHPNAPHFDLKLPKAAGHDPVIARAVLDVLRNHFGTSLATAISAAPQGNDDACWKQMCADLLLEIKSSVQSLDSTVKACIPGEQKRYHVLRRVSEGATMKAACREAGISSQALYDDPGFRPQYEAAKLARKAGKIAARKELGRGKAVRAEDVEADDPEGDLEV